MKKYIETIRTKILQPLLCLSTPLLLGGAGGGLTSCSEWDDHYEDMASQPGNDMTLWQTIQQHPELSDFQEVLSQTKVFKYHKVTGVSYANLLEGAQTFSVLAPVNGSFNKDSLLNLLSTNKGDSMVARSFIGNHLSYSQVTNSSESQEFFLLNSKRASIGKGKALDVDLVESNIKAQGGILHIMKKTLPYRSNIYEVLLNDSRYNKIGEQLNSYDIDEFSPTQSVEGGMVDGEQIYVDSVFIERNRVLESVGMIADEDSNYIAVVPNNEEWERVWNEAMDHFKFDKNVAGGDSLQRYYANCFLLRDAIFSRTIQASPEDSLVTYFYNKHYPKYEVFHKPFQEGGILYGATPIECSNGTIYATDKWPFTPEMTYSRENKTEGEYTSMIIDHKDCNYATRTHAADSVSENGYLAITPEKLTSNWEMTFNLSNTLAATYDICVVVLPASIYDPNAQLKPCKFQATIGYVDEEGNEQTDNCGKNNFSNEDPSKVDTIVVAENFKFPVCNYNQTNNKITVKLKCNIQPREQQKFSRDMFLDCIYLRPKRIINQ